MSEASERSISSAAEAVARSDIGHYHWDLRYDVWAWSPELFALHGVPETATVTTDLLLELKHPEDRDDAIAVIEAARRDGGLFSCEHRIRRRDTGEVRTVVVVGEVEQDHRGAAVTMRGFFVDVSDAPRMPRTPPQATRRRPCGDEPRAGAPHLRVTGSGTVVALSGEIDVDSRGVFELALQEAMAGGAGDVYLDLDRVDFMDVRSVDIVMAVAERLSSAGRALLVLGVPPVLRRVLEILDDPRGRLLVPVPTGSRE